MTFASLSIFALAAVIPLASCFIACGGQAIESSDAARPDGGGSQDTGLDRGAPSEASADGATVEAGRDCGQPGEPMYACPKGPADGGACGPYGAPPDASTNVSYPVGCIVTLPECNTFFPGPQTCNCENFPPKNEPSWVCPM